MAILSIISIRMLFCWIPMEHLIFHVSWKLRCSKTNLILKFLSVLPNVINFENLCSQSYYLRIGFYIHIYVNQVWIFHWPIKFYSICCLCTSNRHLSLFFEKKNTKKKTRITESVKVLKIRTEFVNLFSPTFFYYFSHLLRSQSQSTLASIIIPSSWEHLMQITTL